MFLPRVAAIMGIQAWGGAVLGVQPAQHVVGSTSVMKLEIVGRQKLMPFAPAAQSLRASTQTTCCYDADLQTLPLVCSMLLMLQ